MWWKVQFISSMYLHPIKCKTGGKKRKIRKTKDSLEDYIGKKKSVAIKQSAMI